MFYVKPSLELQNLVANVANSLAELNGFLEYEETILGTYINFKLHWVNKQNEKCEILFQGQTSKDLINIYAKAKQILLENMRPFEYRTHFLNPNELKQIYSHCQNLDWQQRLIKIMGKTISLPRLECFYGVQANYRYSKSDLESKPWTDELLEIKNKIEDIRNFNFTFDVVLLNKYRDGNDSVAWHSDNEKSMLNGAIATISLGATRKFQMKNIETKEIINFNLENNSLFIMYPGCQEKWQHQVPKNKNCNEERISLTFRPFKK